ncbi:hypothetical protein [Paraburkholderia sp. BL10I2N1]|uniref:hypothetical protein n=1 Tax=Paraburkholderia sp. BL10I2N1 TaxID=1938796 RepID=UPI00105C03D4|nr:hypothetical protein [Paraburkholderia sp. BL10I2N1]TDN70405.1 hypothetical protein B0G77_3878 [Paraburkholderia sp. BL10I2N1]
MVVKVANNAFGTLAGNLTSSQTTITLAAGQGARFPVLQPGDWFWGTLNNAANNIEIVKVTALAGDALTVLRGQDNTAGLAWTAGDKFELRTPAALFHDYLDIATFNATIAPLFTGIIALWSGSVATIPAHWHLCDGTTGTPDLRNRFIVGAGSTYAVAATGGAATYSLTVSQLPAHGHGVSDPGHAHSVYDPGHGHGISDPGHVHGVNDPGHVHGWSDGSAQVYAYSGGGSGLSGGSTVNRGTSMNAASANISIAAHGTNISILGAGSNIGIYGAGTSISIQNTGSGSSIENRPPYYALAYIMYTG